MELEEQHSTPTTWCALCGSEVDTSWSNCRGCGAPLSESTIQHQSPNPPSTAGLDSVFEVTKGAVDRVPPEE